ncbi:MAG: glycine zipper 2TM domain-containing protein [Pseudomonadota bacterium]
MLTRRWIVGLTLAGTLAASGAAVADPVREGYRRADEVRFDYARVLDVKPLIRTVQVEIPVRECYDREVVVERRRGGVGRTIAGGIIGGVLGSQIGSGSGRDAATVVGSLIGAAAASEGNRRPPEVRTERFCETRYEFETRERVEGFRVTYQYRGETYVTRTETDPGNRIRVRVSVTPVGR